MPNMSSSQAHYPIAIQTNKSLDRYSMEWAEGELYLAVALLGLGCCSQC